MQFPLSLLIPPPEGSNDRIYFVTNGIRNLKASKGIKRQGLKDRGNKGSSASLREQSCLPTLEFSVESVHQKLEINTPITFELKVHSKVLGWILNQINLKGLSKAFLIFSRHIGRTVSLIWQGLFSDQKWNNTNLG